MAEVRDMITVKEETTLVGVSELRTNIEKIIEESRRHKVLIGKRNKPVAVIMAMEKYNQMEETLETLEDFALGFLAKQRESQSKTSDYLDLHEAQKRVKNK